MVAARGKFIRCTSPVAGTGKKPIAAGFLAKSDGVRTTVKIVRGYSQSNSSSKRCLRLRHHRSIMQHRDRPIRQTGPSTVGVEQRVRHIVIVRRQLRFDSRNSHQPRAATREDNYGRVAGCLVRSTPSYPISNPTSAKSKGAFLRLHLASCVRNESTGAFHSGTLSIGPNGYAPPKIREYFLRSRVS